MTRLLPSSDVAERGIIGSFFMAPKQIGALCAARRLTHSAFHSSALGTIFSVLMELWLADEEAVDAILLVQKLADRGLLEQVGGDAMIFELSAYPTACMAGRYTDILTEKQTLRAIIALCTEYISRAYEEQENVAALIEGLSAAVTEAAGAGQRKEAKSFKEELMDKISRIEDDTPELNLIQTGLTLLDRHSPLHRGDMPMIAGEKKAGKSIMSLTIAMNIARAGGAILYFSLEDKVPKVIDRIFAGATHIPIVRQNKKSLNEGDFPRITRAMNELSERRVQIRDDVYDLAQIAAVARQHKSKWPDLTIFVDYLQLVRTETGRSREQEVAAVSRTLRLLGMELDAAIIVLSQLNEDGKSRESRAIEQDITAAWMVNKPENEKDENSVRILSIPFQRNGDSGIKFPVTFHGRFARMEDCARTDTE